MTRSFGFLWFVLLLASGSVILYYGRNLWSFLKDGTGDRRIRIRIVMLYVATCGGSYSYAFFNLVWGIWFHQVMSTLAWRLVMSAIISFSVFAIFTLIQTAAASQPSGAVAPAKHSTSKSALYSTQKSSTIENV
eukprot:GILK01019100.1.p1 GENE.GILK01019100.1~~GILK01019100.1.p1  ORF type:complete len:134 (+),score=20.12 GILK01019100.1:454-855(+)